MPAITESRYRVDAGWSDVPHLDEDTKRELLASTPRYLRDARSRGTPSLGAGAIYPFPLSQILVQPFEIPAYWPRAYGMDVGWNRTAAIWGAHDRQSDTWYLYTEHYMGEERPVVHAQAIRARGAWIPGVIDPASRGRQQKDGEQLIQNYRDLGLKLQPADNAVEAGLWACEQLFGSGRLKVFTTCQAFVAEFQFYRRDEKGRIVKENDHCLHADTVVITRRGRARIVDLVGTEGEVLTVGGRFARYQSCRKTALDQALVRAIFSDGTSVTCTPDHRFLTPDGWVQASDLAGRSCYASSVPIIRNDSRCASLSSPKRLRSSWAAATISAASISSAMAFACIAKFGSRLTGALSRTASTFIMSTATSATTTQRTSRSWKPENTSAITRLVTTAASLLRRWLRLPNGTDLRPVAIGTASTMPRLPIGSTSVRSSGARNAAALSTRLTASELASARMPARHALGPSLVSTTSTNPAQSAGQRSGSTSTPGRKPALGSAAVRCLGVVEAGRGDVYCMEVPETHAFAVEGGVIVHNCMDAMRYLILSGRQFATTQPVERPVISHYDTIDSEVGY